MATQPTEPVAPTPEASNDLADDVFRVFGPDSFAPPVAEPAAEAAPAEAPAQAPEPQPAAPAAQPPVAAPAPLPAVEQVQQPPVSPTSPAAAQPPVPAAPDPAKLEMESLRAQVAQLTQFIEQNKVVPSAQPAQPQAEQPLVTAEEARYGLKIPQEVLEAVFSEDPGAAANGLTHLINSLSTVIHTNVLTAARKDLQNFRTELSTQSGEDQLAKARNEAQAEYYRDFPNHNNPTIKVIVAAEAQKLGVEFPGLPWGDDFKNALGARVNGVLASLVSGNPAQPAPQAPTTPVSPSLQPNAPVQQRPAGFMPVNPSSNTIPQFEQDQDLIASTFSFGS